MSFINQFAQSVQKYGPQAFSLNYRIADDPELSGEEYHACAAYVEACRALGMEVTEQFAGLPTAFKATVRKASNPVLKVALLAEYDALPEIGHGCGHSANGAMSFLTAAAFWIWPIFPCMLISSVRQTKSCGAARSPCASRESFMTMI